MLSNTKSNKIGCVINTIILFRQFYFNSTKFVLVLEELKKFQANFINNCLLSFMFLKRILVMTI